MSGQAPNGYSPEAGRTARKAGPSAPRSRAVRPLSERLVETRLKSSNQPERTSERNGHVDRSRGPRQPGLLVASGLNTPVTTSSAAEAPTITGSALAARILAVLRVATGFIFLWAAWTRSSGGTTPPPVKRPGSTEVPRPRASSARSTRARSPRCSTTWLGTPFSTSCSSPPCWRRHRRHRRSGHAGRRGQRSPADGMMWLAEWLWRR